MNAVQLDMFEIADAESKGERFKERAKVVHKAIREIDSNINVVAIFCDIVHSFVVEEGGKFNLYIFNDYEKLDSFRFDNRAFEKIPKNFIKIK